VSVSAGKTYINLLRGEKKYGILQPSSADRLDIGIKLKGKAAHGRFEPAGTWNPMVTHRVRIIDAKDIDAKNRLGLRAHTRLFDQSENLTGKSMLA
jgi:hypothetical protein